MRFLTTAPSSPSPADPVPDAAPVSRGTVVVFSVALVIIFGALAAALFASLPSNVVLGEDEGFRLNLNIIASEQFPFFTKSPESETIGVYRVSPSGGVQNLISTPQGRPDNLFGLSRKQRAQGPEVAFLANAASTPFVDCAGSAVDCVNEHRHDAPVALTNTSPVATVCGRVFLTIEQPVPFEYRNLVPYEHRVEKVAVLQVTCGEGRG